MADEQQKAPRVTFTTGESPTSIGTDTRLTVAGVDITSLCRAVRFEAAVGDLNRVVVEMAPRFDVEMPSQVDLVAQVFPGYELIEEPLPNGGKRFRCAPSPSQRAGDEPV